MIRRVFTLTSALSLFLALAVAIVWVRSYWVRDSFQYWHTQWGIEVRSNWGEMSVYVPTASDPYNLGEGWGDDTFAAERIDRLDGVFVGFGRTWVSIEGDDGKITGREPLYWCPHWALVVVFAVMPTAVIARRVRRHRIFKSSAVPEYVTARTPVRDRRTDSALA